MGIRTGGCGEGRERWLTARKSGGKVANGGPNSGGKDFQAGDAEDLAQEVFLRCYTACGAFDTAQALRPWLIGIARNLLREFARKQKRRKEVYWVELCLEVDESANPAEGVYDEVIEHLPDCLQTLGGSAREAINLKYGGRLRLAEIGRRLRRSEGAVKLLMFRARQTLRSCLAGKCKISPDE